METDSNRQRDPWTKRPAPSADAGSVGHESGLPVVPGGWSINSIDVGGEPIELTQPATPDAFLEDPEVLDANSRDDYMPYWSYLWPAAVSMAEGLRHAGWSKGTEVLELGCGVGLVGLAALRQGWRVTLSDHDPIAVECAMFNARRNGLADRATPLVLDWRAPLIRKWPVILGCEVTYEARNHPVLLDLLDKMLAPDGVCWFADPGRSQAPRFVSRAVDRDFQVRMLDQEAQSRGLETGTGFQIIEVRK